MLMGWRAVRSGFVIATVAVAVVLAGLGAAGAASFSSTATYTLTVSKSGSGSGTVTSSPAGIDCGTVCSATFAQGTYVWLTTQPDGKSDFSGWQGGVGSCSALTEPCLVLMDKDIQTTAIFTSYSVSVSTDGTGSGTVRSTPDGIDCGTTCTAWFTPETDITLIEAPGPGSVFSGWRGACPELFGVCEFTLGPDLWASATFTKLPPPYPSRTILLSPRRKTSSCLLRGPLPDHACSPGAVYTDVSQAALCTPAYAAAISNRPFTHGTRVFREYAIPRSQQGRYTLDHHVPLDLGGSNDISNIWPEATFLRSQKQRLDRKLHRLVCTNQTTLDTAQRAIAANWKTL
jgi:hypothetical protein